MHGFAEGLVSVLEGKKVLPEGTMIIGRYCTGKCLGRRGECLWYEAWDGLFEENVHLREYFPEDLAVREGETGVMAEEGLAYEFESGLEAFRESCRQMIRLYKQENILNVRASFYANGTAYAACDVCNSPTLGELIDERGALDFPEAFSYLLRASMPVRAALKIAFPPGAVLTLDGFLVTDFGELILTDPPGEHVAYDLTLLFGQLCLGDRDAGPERVMRKLKSSRKSIPTRKRIVLKDALYYESEGKIYDPEEFFSKLFNDSKTVQAGKKGRVKRLLLIGVIVLSLAVIAFLAWRFGAPIFVGETI